MMIDINYELLKENMCPRCMSTFMKSATGYDNAIHCTHCGFDTPIEKYRSVILPHLAQKFAPPKLEDDLILN